MKNKVLLLGSLFLAACLSALIVLAYVVGSIGTNTKMSRSAPSKPDILNLIEDESARQVFASLRLESAQDKGFVDSLIESNWCGASATAIESLFTSNVFKKVSAEEFSIKMSAPIKQRFDLYGWRPYRHGEMGLGVKNQSGCIKLFFVEIT